MSILFPTRIKDVPDVSFPRASEPLVEHRGSVSWSQWMDEMETELAYYLLHYDNAEDRVAGKPGKRFRI